MRTSTSKSALLAERLHRRVARRSHDSPTVGAVVRWCQRWIGTRWMFAIMRPRLEVIGADNLPEFDASRSYVLVANHRSFFDLFVVTSYLFVARGVRHQLLFPVRAEFIYERFLGVLLNGAVSFFAMYPPIYRDRARIADTIKSLEEIKELIGKGGILSGIHPEGTRNKGSDPYELLPAKAGIGRIVHGTEAPVIPVFINGLSNNILLELWRTVTGSDERVVIVFGAPLQLDEHRAARARAKTFINLARLTHDAIASLGVVERQAREAGAREREEA